MSHSLFFRLSDASHAAPVSSLRLDAVTAELADAGLNTLGMVWVEGSLVQFQEMLHLVAMWFGSRTREDDDEAITVRLVKNPYGESLAFQDVRFPLHQHHGAKGFSTSLLEREEPGSFQEEDIIKCLSMCFPQDHIYHSPLRTTDKEEICDVMVINDDRVLIIQAKDSPNIERIVQGSPPLSRTLTRRPIEAMRSVHVEAKEVQRGVQARCG